MYWLDGRESAWTPGVGDGQGGLVCWDSWGRKESDTTEQLIWSDLIWLIHPPQEMSLESHVSPSQTYGIFLVSFCHSFCNPIQALDWTGSTWLLKSLWNLSPCLSNDHYYLAHVFTTSCLSDCPNLPGGASLLVSLVRSSLSSAGGAVWFLVGKLGPHKPCHQKNQNINTEATL